MSTVDHDQFRSANRNHVSRRAFMITGGGLVGCATVLAFLEGARRAPLSGAPNALATSTGTPYSPDGQQVTATSTGAATVTPPTEAAQATSPRVDYLGREILGPIDPPIADSVWPGGVDEDPTGFTDIEAGKVVGIYNGASELVQTDNTRQRLSAARAFAESEFGVRGQFDGGTLSRQNGRPDFIAVRGRNFVRTSGLYYQVVGKDEGESIFGLIYEVFAPPGYSYMQIAVKDSSPGTAYVNNTGTVISGEKLYVLEVYKRGADGSLYVANTLTYRGACGNIGREGQPLPEATPGATPTMRHTPTEGAETPTFTNTPSLDTPTSTGTRRPDTSTPTPTSTDTLRPPTSTPTATFTPTPEPSPTPVPTNTHMPPTATIETPFPSPVPTNTHTPPTATIGPIPTEIRITPTQVPPLRVVDRRDFIKSVFSLLIGR